MKKIIIYVILLMLFGFTSTIAQAVKTKTTDQNQASQITDDPKLSPEEKAQLLKAGEDNPARIAEALQLDPKVDLKSLPTEDDFGENNAKPAEADLEDAKLKNEALLSEIPVTAVPDVPTQPANNQPAGEQGGILHDYRNMPSDGGTQPAGETPENIPNYREMQGNGTQPPGDIPNK